MKSFTTFVVQNGHSTGKLKELFRTIAKWMLITLFVSYYMSATLFSHTHYFAWGTVTHSHPYNPFSDKPLNHSHTPGQCLIIALLTHIVAVCTATAYVVFATVLMQRIVLPTRRLRHCSQQRFSPLRAPPYFSYYHF
jgi:hypothetical protein